MLSAFATTSQTFELRNLVSGNNTRVVSQNINPLPKLPSATFTVPVVLALISSLASKPVASG